MEVLVLISSFLHFMLCVLAQEHIKLNLLERDVGMRQSMSIMLSVPNCHIPSHDLGKKRRGHEASLASAASLLTTHQLSCRELSFLTQRLSCNVV